MRHRLLIWLSVYSSRCIYILNLIAALANEKPIYQKLPIYPYFFRFLVAYLYTELIIILASRPHCYNDPAYRSLGLLGGHKLKPFISSVEKLDPFFLSALAGVEELKHANVHIARRGLAFPHSEQGVCNLHSSLYVQRRHLQHFFHARQHALMDDYPGSGS